MQLNSIYNEDCLEGMKRIPDKSIDMILCDLPYGTTRNKWDVIIPFEPLWEQYNRIIKNNGAIVLFAKAFSKMGISVDATVNDKSINNLKNEISNISKFSNIKISPTIDSEKRK